MNQAYLTLIIIIGFKSSNYIFICEWSTLYQYDQWPFQLIIAITVFAKVLYILDHTD